MMKNVYDLGAMDIQKDNFKLNIVYRNDSVGTDMQYINEGSDKIKNKILLQVIQPWIIWIRKMKPNPDGKFRLYFRIYYSSSKSGRIIFPELEPFGSNIRQEAIDA